MAEDCNKHCSAFKTCEKLKKCPNAPIDDDKDSIPCERQHCYPKDN